MHSTQDIAIQEVRKVHPGLWSQHIKKLLGTYTVSEICLGRIENGTFYPACEIGKQYLECNKKKPLLLMKLWSPRNK